MPLPVMNFAELDLRGAFDLAIMIEEDAQLRYEELSRLVPDDVGGPGAFFRAMARNEAKHRTELEARRRVLFRNERPRVEISVMDGARDVEIAEVELPASRREALQAALAAEERAYAFYAGALPYVRDPGVRAFFEELKDEEQEHQAMLRRELEALR